MAQLDVGGEAKRQRIEWRGHPKSTLSLREGGGVLGARMHAFILSLFIQSITTTCACWCEGAQRLSTEHVRGVHVYLCAGMHVWTSEGRRSRLQGED